ncbi:TIGR03564 family F420-dependent LLM class oxidoreductase [Nocardia sp. NPDC001965]
MRIGLMVNERGLTMEQLGDEARIARDAGLATFWMGHHYDWDPLVALTATAREVSRIELGTAIVPSYPLHPIALASQALSAQAATGNRLTLGVGLSHRPIIEGRFGFNYDHPARHLREYLTVLGPLLRGETVSYRGETLSAAGSVSVTGAVPPALLVSALGRLTLKIAGELADGTITNWAGPRTLANHIVPAVIRAAGNRHPRIVAMIMVCVTDDVSAARESAATSFRLAGQLDSYRAMLEREGVDTIADLIITGDEESVEYQLRRQVDVGVTEFVASLLGSAAERKRAIELLAQLNQGSKES